MKTKSRFPLLLTCLLVLGGCLGTRTPQPLLKADFGRGMQVFNVFCADCHQNPDNEAPQLDEADDWDLRTLQWASLLKDHVKAGFLDMPAKGGHPELTDQNIKDALYFIENKVKAEP